MSILPHLTVNATNVHVDKSVWNRSAFYVVLLDNLTGFAGLIFGFAHDFHSYNLDAK